MATFLIGRVSGQPEPFTLISYIFSSPTCSRPQFLTICSWPITMDLCSLASVWFFVKSNKFFMRSGAKKMMSGGHAVFASVPSINHDKRSTDHVKCPARAAGTGDIWLVLGLLNRHDPHFQHPHTPFLSFVEWRSSDCFRCWFSFLLSILITHFFFPSFFAFLFSQNLWPVGV